MSRVVVVGSLNCDMVMRVPRHPAKGETIQATSFSTFVGGKGNNQALACARAGAEVWMVGRIGRDPFGDRIEQKLVESGVHCDFVVRDDELGTGVADIWVDAAGENSIVIAPQANGRLSPLDIDRAASAIEGASHLLLQLEIPMEAVIAAARAARGAGAKVIFNPAPAPPNGIVPRELLALASVIVPNQSEAELITGVKVTDVASAVDAARALSSMGIGSVIVTLGKGGALVADLSAEPIAIPCFSVNVVDTTAAGDAFCGALAASLAAGQSLRDAAVRASAAGALACTILGAEPSLPDASAIDRLLSR